jgi:1-deoxy-D-xylulose-5-phosphate synthase
MIVMAPKDENELRHMLYTQVQYEDGPTALRYPRGAGLGVPMDPELRIIPIGQAEPLREGDDVLLFALGSMVHPSLEAAEVLAGKGVSAAVVNARFVKPLDEELLVEYASRTGNVVTVEESQRAGGFGSAVAELLHDRGLHGVRVTSVALPDAFVEHGAPGILRNQVELTPDAIARRALSLLNVSAAVRETSRRPA